MAINWEEVQALSNAVLVLTSAGAIGYAALQLRHERAYRAVSNLEKQLTFFMTPGFQTARRRLATARVENASLLPWSLEDPPIEAFEVLDFYDHLGLLVKKGHLDLYDVWHTFYEWAQPVYVDLQKLLEDPSSDFIDHYTDLRRLMRQLDEIQLQRMHRKKGNHWALWTPERILDYYNYELAIDETERQDTRSRWRRRNRSIIPSKESETAPHAGRQ